MLDQSCGYNGIMVTPEKIEQWLKEAEARPESAGLMLKYITQRLLELDARNQELLAENIALQDGSRVEEYQQRIAHLEYELGLLKRRYGKGDTGPEDQTSPAPAESQPASLLIYNAKGRLLRIELPSPSPSGETLGRLRGDLVFGGEPVRLLIAAADEELLFLFSSGRAAVHPLSAIPMVENESAWDWESGVLPDEPRAGELLVSLSAAGNLPLADFFLQASRRGCVKKTMTSMAESILSNRFIGRGINQKGDQAFDLLLSRKGDRLLLVTHEGRLLCLEVDPLSYAAEDRIHLDGSDHVVAALLLQPEESFLVLTQSGKVIQRQASQTEPSRSPQARGQALLSPARLDQGVRLIGAARADPAEQVLALHADGQLSLHTAQALGGAGSLTTEAGLTACASWTVRGSGK
jgi:DNA gyrase/topoisomerase IV subunit A